MTGGKYCDPGVLADGGGGVRGVLCADLGRSSSDRPWNSWDPMGLVSLWSYENLET